MPYLHECHHLSERGVLSPMRDTNTRALTVVSVLQIHPCTRWCLQKGIKGDGCWNNNAIFTDVVQNKTNLQKPTASIQPRNPVARS